MAHGAIMITEERDDGKIVAPAFPIFMEPMNGMGYGAMIMTEDREQDKFLSARTWARRWDCSVSTVRRAAVKFGVRHVFVGDGPNGLVRYTLADVEKIEREACLDVNHGRRASV